MVQCIIKSLQQETKGLFSFVFILAEKLEITHSPILKNALILTIQLSVDCFGNVPLVQEKPLTDLELAEASPSDKV